MKSFETWNYEEVEDAFGISLVDSLPKYEDWIKAENCEPNLNQRERLDILRNLLLDETSSWNLNKSMLFSIVPIENIVDFHIPDYDPFETMRMTNDRDNFNSSCKVDYLIPEGKMNHQITYFCLHEYKHVNSREKDLLGQLLIGMVNVQVTNPDGLPIYGCYVSGYNYVFVFLIGRKYCISDAYVATSEDLYKIFAIMKKCKLLANVHAQKK
jgi:hypothetical protein